MRFGVIRAILPLTLLLSPVSAAEPLRLIRSLSGPSGTVSGSSFIFDSTRNRFVYPQDKSLTIFFEWDAPPGTHVLTGIWKLPDGRIGTISPDVKIDAPTKVLTCYWIFNLVPGLQNGFWTLDVRVDGQPAGSHPFEIAGMEEPKPEPAPAPTPPKPPTLDEIFKAASPSLVWIRRLDNAGRRIDSASGFIVERDRIATAFQAVDAAAQIEIEFADGRKVVVGSLRAWSRGADWAVLDAATDSSVPLPQGDAKSVAVGDRLIVFNVESGARVMGGVDIGGRRVIPGFGERIQISPAVALEAAGGPLLDLNGRVVGILGGGLHPGVRSTGQISGAIPNAVTPISEVPRVLPVEPKSIESLLQEGVLITPVRPMTEILYAASSNQLSKNPANSLPPDVAEFSTRDAQIFIYALIAKKGKSSKGELSISVFDPVNRLRAASPGKKVTVSEPPERFSVGFSPFGFQAGVYRIDLNWDGHPVWRKFIRISD